MWHLKTKMGTFWIIPTEADSKYWLGVEEERLGLYDDAGEAAHDVFEQQTGYAMWDAQNRVKAPTDIKEWESGEPEDWQ